jgi:hypothetical protein
MTATCISVRGERTTVTPQTPPLFSAPELQMMVEGTPEFLHLPDGSLLVYHDTAYEIGMEQNEEATRLALDVLPEETWLAGFVLHIVVSKETLRGLSANKDAEPGHFQLYMLRFERCDDQGRYLCDNLALVYAREETELHQRIAVVASTSAKGQRLLGVERREHGLTIMHEHVPASVTVREEGVRRGE